MELSCLLLAKSVFGRIVCLDFAADWEKISRVDPEGFLFFVCPKKNVNKPSGNFQKLTIMTNNDDHFGVISFEVGM